MVSPSMLSGMCLGACMAWTTLVVQHTANHGGLLNNPAHNYIYGLFDDLMGGTSLLWRFHHNVSLASVRKLFKPIKVQRSGTKLRSFVTRVFYRSRFAIPTPKHTLEPPSRNLCDVLVG